MPLSFPPGGTSVKLDIVGLLAVVGESAMAGHVQPATASKTALLPRLLPAVQAFIKPSRPYRLPDVPNITVMGLYSGNSRKSLNFFPSLLHEEYSQDPFQLRTITIQHQAHRKRFRDIGKRSSDTRIIRALRMGVINMLSVVGFGFFVVLLIVAAVVCRDGMAVLAIILLGATSSAVGLGSLWTVELQRRKADRAVPPGDVMIVTKHAGFLLVRCNDFVARELYFGSERCKYAVGDREFNVLSATATLMFMGAVICCANAEFTMQATIGMSYIALNFAYWLAALIPGKWHWDLNAYRVISEDVNDVPKDGKNYTGVIVEAIRATCETDWVWQAELVPHTEAWKKWLAEAKENCRDLDWNGQQALSKCIQAFPCELSEESEIKYFGRKLASRQPELEMQEKDTSV